MEFFYTDEEAAAIERASRQRDRSETRIARATYFDGRIVLELMGGAIEGAQISFPARSLQPFQEADDAGIAAMTVTKHGNAVHWPQLDVQISAVGLVRKVTGLPATAAEIGRKGGSAVSAAKAQSARLNGRKGGRPRKAAA